MTGQAAGVGLFGGTPASLPADIHPVSWWEWTLAVIWGPAAVAVAGLLVAVLIGRTRLRLQRRRPVLVDRRQPDRAWLREAMDGRGVPKSLSAVERELAELTTGDRQMSEDVRRTR
jgi:hypothetical protein